MSQLPDDPVRFFVAVAVLSVTGFGLGSVLWTILGFILGAVAYTWRRSRAGSFALALVGAVLYVVICVLAVSAWSRIVSWVTS